MSISDVIKKSFLEGFAMADISTGKILVALGITLALAVYIFFIYRLANKSCFYSKSFNKTLALMSVVTAAIVLAMQSNIVISLGMVGALSIVRFRNAVKEPLDLLFLFWSISVGIICGAGLYEVAVITCVLVTAAVFLLELVPVAKAPYLLVVNSTDKGLEKRLLPVVQQYTKRLKVRSRSMTMEGLDLIIELRTAKEAELVEAVGALEQVTSVSLLSHDGELRA